MLIIGGNGFIGSHLANELARLKVFIRIYDRATHKNPIDTRNVEYRLGDISDSSSLMEALHGIDVVYHLVSTSLPSTSNIDPIGDIQNNLVSTIKLLDTMVQLKVMRIIFLSSGGTVYGNPSTSIVSETEVLKPICSYGIVKAAIENYLSLYQQSHGLIPTVLRPSNPFGPWQSHIGVHGLIATTFNRIVNKEPIAVWGDGSHIRDYLYISDLVDLCVKAGLSNKTGVFNAGYGEGYSINDIIKKIESITGIPANIKYLDGRPFDVKKNVLNVALAKKTFNWAPKVSIDAGLKKYWEWINSNQR